MGLYNVAQIKIFNSIQKIQCVMTLPICSYVMTFIFLWPPLQNCVLLSWMLEKAVASTFVSSALSVSQSNKLEWVQITQYKWSSPVNKKESKSHSEAWIRREQLLLELPLEGLFTLCPVIDMPVPFHLKSIPCGQKVLSFLAFAYANIQIHPMLYY